MPDFEKDSRTVLGLSTADRTILIAGAPLLGAGLGAALPWLANLAVNTSWVPSHGALEFVAGIDTWIAALVLGVVGIVAGAAFAWFAIAEAVVVEVTDDALVVGRPGEGVRIDRADVRSVYLDGKNLVVLDEWSCQRVRDRVESSESTTADAMRRHGYPWADRDPFADLYRRWVPGTPDLPGPVDALMRVRETALEKKVDDDVAEYRGELEKLGVTVRDKGTAQYWRPLVQL